MSDKKQLNESELEKINGGIDYVKTEMPSVFLDPIDKYKVEDHKGEDLYFKKSDTFFYGTVIDSREVFNGIPLTKRMQKVKVIKTNKPMSFIVGNTVDVSGDDWQAYLNAQ